MLLQNTKNVKNVNTEVIQKDIYYPITTRVVIHQPYMLEAGKCGSRVCIWLLYEDKYITFMEYVGIPTVNTVLGWLDGTLTILSNTYLIQKAIRKIITDLEEYNSKS